MLKGIKNIGGGKKQYSAVVLFDVVYQKLMQFYLCLKIPTKGRNN